MRFFGGTVRMMRYTLAIFDMDGTLTEELLDFAAIRRDIGMPAAGAILEHIAGLSDAERRRALDILDVHENAAAESCRVHDGAAEVLSELRRRAVRVALLTRNSRTSAARILGRHGLVLDHISTREDVPHKPHPESILSIIRRFGGTPQQTLMIGDYLL